MRLASLLIALHFVLSACQSTTNDKNERLVIVSHLGNMPEALHPTNNPTQERLEIFTYIHAFLLSEDIVSHELKPGVLAQLPVFDEFNHTYQCAINKQARFDDGQKVTVDDIAFTFKINACAGVLNGSAKGYFANLLDVVATDSFNFTLQYREANIEDLYLLGEFPVLQKSFYDSMGALSSYSYQQLKNEFDEIKDPILTEYIDAFNGAKYATNLAYISGLGAYKLEKWDQTQIVLTKKENNWHDTQDAENIADNLIFRLNADYTSRVLDLKNKIVDVSAGYSSKEIAELQADTGITNHYEIRMEPIYSHTLIALNCRPDVAGRTPYFTDSLVRKAFAYIFPIQEAMDKLSNGVAIRIVSSISPNKSGYNTHLQPYNFDLEKAEALLAEAGWKDSDNDGILDKKINNKKTDFKVSFMCPPSPLFQAVSKIFIEGAKETGIDIVLESPENWREKLMQKHNFDLFFFSVTNAPGPSYPFSLFQSDDFPQGNNFAGYSNPKLDSLMARVSKTFDIDKRNKLLFEIQEILYHDLPYIYVSTGRRGIVVSKRFLNIETSGVLPMIMLNKLKPSKQDN